MNTISILKTQRKAISVVILLLGLVSILAVVGSQTIFRSRAQTPSLVEAESAVLSQGATLGDDAQASGGKYVQFGTRDTGSLSFQPSAPYYGTFFYQWYKNPNTDTSWSYWPDHANNPPNTWFSKYLPDPNPTIFDPANELYSANNYEIFKWQVSKLAEARQEVAIASWWGQGTKEDVAFNNIINDFMTRPDNPYPNLRWSMYYEDEGFADPSVATLVSDLTHIKNTFTNSPYYFTINGKPVIFVYGNAADEPGTLLQRWSDANAQIGNAFYYVLKVFSGYATASPQPSSWHQYAPAIRSSQHGSYSYMVSPGFWLDDGVSAERLPRNATEFENAVKSMVSSNATWKLTETWNEWGEGTSVEPGEQVRFNSTTNRDESDPNGYPFKNLYVDILARNLPPLEQGVGINPTPTQTTSSDPVLVASGDIACGSTTPATLPCQQQATANLITSMNPTAVLTLGDNQYDNGALSDFQNFYDKSWGAFKAKTYPVIGNHEGGEGGSNTGYFDYFNGAQVETGPAGDRSKGYYSFDLGSWHIIVLNSNCGKYSFNGSSTGCDVGSPQVEWLKADLAAHPNQCTLAAWHSPRFSSGHDGNSTNTATYVPFWQALYDANVDIILSGHSHDYEAFHPQDPSGNLDTLRGIRQFVVGTGGRDFTGWWTSSLANSRVRNNNTFGVLKLTLHEASVDYQFVPATGVNGYTNGTFTDSGTNIGCH